MLEIDGLTKTYTQGARAVVALDGIDLRVGAGEVVTILGPSGCGKSTLLHLIGGFERPTAGRVRVDGRPVAGPGRDRGMVFQTPTLFGWSTVLANVAWPLEVGGMRRSLARGRAAELLELVGLGDAGRAYPAELSGGMAQRAAIARTLALEPAMLLMDEPFGALDALTRETLQYELGRIWREAGLTVLFVTHDISEAVLLADRVVVMSGRPGRILEQRAVPLPVPRSAATRSAPVFTRLREDLWALLRGEPAVGGQQAGPG